MDNLPTTRPGETPCARARELSQAYTGNARGGIQEPLAYRNLTTHAARRPIPPEPPPPKPPDPPPDDDCTSVSTAVSACTDFSCETASSVLSFVPDAGWGVAAGPSSAVMLSRRYTFDDFVTDCLQENSPLNGMHEEFLAGFHKVCFGRANPVYYRQLQSFTADKFQWKGGSRYRRIFWCWKGLCDTTIVHCDECAGGGMCSCNIVMCECDSECDSDCDVHEREVEPTWRHMLCSAFFDAPDCFIANDAFVDARACSYPSVLQNLVGEAAAERRHRQLTSRIKQAALAGDLPVVCWGASFAARGAAEAAAAWEVAADKLLAWCVGAPKRIRKRARVDARKAAAVAWAAAGAAARKARKVQVNIARRRGAPQSPLGPLTRIYEIQTPPFKSP